MTKERSGRNRLANTANMYQGNFKRVLCLCSAGMLRSPTTAVVLASEFGCNTRAAGLSEEYALVRVDDVLLVWAQEIVVMDKFQNLEVIDLCVEYEIAVPPIHVFNIPDNFAYMDPTLQNVIREEAEKAGFVKVK